MARSELREREIYDGMIVCPMALGDAATCSTRAAPMKAFAERDLALHIADDAFNLVLLSRRELHERRNEARLQAMLAEEMARRERMNERERRILQAKTKIIEEHLTWKCPRPDCRQAFFDFQGCTALECSRCPCRFCGWCLADCGTDAQDHVRQCPEKPPDCDMFFPRPLERFNRHWRERRAALVRQTLNDDLRDEEERAEVREALREHLAELDDPQ